MFKSISLLLAVIFVQGVLSQVYFKGTCPPVTPVSNFDAEKFSGMWYSDRKYSFEFSNSVKCNYIKLNLTSANPTFTTGGVNASDNQPIVLATWTVEIFASGQLAVGTPEGSLYVNGVTFQILGTNNNGWASAYGCRNVNETHYYRNAWLLTRENLPPKSVVDDALNVYTSQGVSTEYFTKNDQNNCPAL